MICLVSINNFVYKNTRITNSFITVQLQQWLKTLSHVCSDNAEGLIKYRVEIRGSKNSSLSSEAVTLYNLNSCTSHYTAQQQQLKEKACSCVRQGISQLMLGCFIEIS